MFFSKNSCDLKDNGTGTGTFTTIIIIIKNESGTLTIYALITWIHFNKLNRQCHRW